jgi:hypothetical protein
MNKHLIWLQINRRKVNINLLENECNLPTNTVAKWLNGERPLPTKHHAVIIEWVIKFRG